MSNKTIYLLALRHALTHLHTTEISLYEKIRLPKHSVVLEIKTRCMARTRRFRLGRASLTDQRKVGRMDGLTDGHRRTDRWSYIPTD